MSGITDSCYHSLEVIKLFSILFCGLVGFLCHSHPISTFVMCRKEVKRSRNLCIWKNRSTSLPFCRCICVCVRCVAKGVGKWKSGRQLLLINTIFRNHSNQQWPKWIVAVFYWGRRSWIPVIGYVKILDWWILVKSI